jgi:hypothetical protein
MNWGTAKKTDTKKGQDKIVELHPSGSDSSLSPGEEKSARPKRATQEDLESGMELLELDFLLGIIESTDGDDKNDVTMRKLCFNEVLRRQQQNEIDSFALKVYSVNDNNLYGKTIQCEAMKDLALRTEHNTKLNA